MDNAAANGLSPAMLDRLKLDAGRVAATADGVEQVAGLPNPLGSVIDRSVRPNGLELSRVRVPLGVIGIIYESRPNVTADAAALCLRAGNAVILRGGSEAKESNRAILSAMAEGSSPLACLPMSCNSFRRPTAPSWARCCGPANLST